MPVTQERTLQQIRRSVGFMLGAVTTSRPTTTGTTTSHTDVSILGFNTVDQFRGRWLHSLGESSGTVVRVSGNSTAGVFGYLTAVATRLSTASEYELWDEDMPPARMDDFITRAVLDVTRKAAIPTTDLSVHTASRFFSYPLSTTIAGVSRVEFRWKHERQEIESCDAAWNDQTLANTTRVADTEDHREGTGSNRIDIAAAATTGVLAVDTFTALNLSRYTHIEGWLKSDVATTTSDLQIRLATSSSLASPVQNLALPALTSGTWTPFRIAMPVATGMTSIAAVGLNLVTDLGAQKLWVDGIQATNAGTEEWQEVPRRFWRIDQDRRELVFNDEARRLCGYALLKLWTVAKPTLPSANASLIQIDPEYVTYRAAAMAMRARADRRGANRTADLQQADIYDRLAEGKRLRLQSPDGIRWVES